MLFVSHLQRGTHKDIYLKEKEWHLALQKQWFFTGDSMNPKITPCHILLDSPTMEQSEDCSSFILYILLWDHKDVQGTMNLLDSAAGGKKEVPFIAYLGIHENCISTSYNYYWISNSSFLSSWKTYLSSGLPNVYLTGPTSLFTNLAP